MYVRKKGFDAEYAKKMANSYRENITYTTEEATWVENQPARLYISKIKDKAELCGKLQDLK